MFFVLGSIALWISQGSAGATVQYRQLVGSPCFVVQQHVRCARHAARLLAAYAPTRFVLACFIACGA